MQFRLPIKKPALGINGLDLIAEADPETGTVRLAFKGGPFSTSAEVDPAVVEELGNQLVAVGVLGRQFRGECVGLKRECGTCAHGEFVNHAAQIGRCRGNGFATMDAVKRDRPGCVKWAPEGAA